MAPKVSWIALYTRNKRVIFTNNCYQPASTAGKAPASSTASKAPAKTTPSEKAAKKTSKTAAGGEDKKKKRKVRKETYSSYIYKGEFA